MNIHTKSGASRAIAELTALFGNRLVTSSAVCEQHAQNTTWLPKEPPDAVIFPQSTDDVQTVVRICAKHSVPVIAFGAGTSLEGHVIPLHRGITTGLPMLARHE